MNHFSPQAWVDSHNRRDLTAFLAWFSPEAEVEDEQALHRGTEQIGAWIQGTWKAYETTWTLLDPVPQQDDLRLEVSGTFPGSPLVFRKKLLLEGSRIRRLEVVLD
jgi:hypothetical protein